jgi:hypothetical protein
MYDFLEVASVSVLKGKKMATNETLSLSAVCFSMQ